MFNKSISKEYSFLVPLLLGSYHLKTQVRTDADRRAIVLSKYNLSKHSLYCLLKDYANDPYNKRWYYSDKCFSFHGTTERYELLDTDTGFGLTIRYNGGMDPRKNSIEKQGYVYSYLDVKMVHGNVEMRGEEIFTKTETLYIMYILNAVKSMKQKMDNITRQQNNYKFITRMKSVY